MWTQKVHSLQDQGMFGKACFDITVQIQRKAKLKNIKYRLEQ